jgi:hypothetical protein
MKMIRSKIAMGFLWALLSLLAHVVPGVVAPVHAQGTRKDDIVFNSRGIPLAGATVRVCAMPASGQPCTPLALIYSDAALTQALANPTSTDGTGNYFFYAAPGKYEIEISGPAITTKQIPNVILPNDPASPSFSAISAFSLTLSGNLTVNGNTTVVGNLASGTLNLTNQSTPPGSASSGTVNMYTKTADKRLYYKDDAGTEVGPLGAGAQTTAVNTFTANQNMDSGLHIKGPDPYSDMGRYGGYFNTAPSTTTASCTNSSTSVTLASALDFQDASKFPGTNIGNGIVIYGCGAASGLTTPPAYTVTPFGLTGGSTTYNYKVVAEDLQGGLTAASANGTTTTGASTLGVNSVTLTAASWNNTLNGEQVYTCSGNCNLSVNAPINIAGFTNSHFNGNYTIIATNGTNQFTVFSPAPNGYLVTSESASATVSVLACNILSMNTSGVIPNTIQSGGETVMRWWVYRNGTLSFVVQGNDSYYEDCGTNMSASFIPSYVPSSPGSAANKYLATTIVSGGGTTSIVVANAAGATASGQTALHDNSQNLLACMTASRNGTPCYIPLAANPPFEAATVFTSANSGSAHLLMPSLNLDQPWVVRGGGVLFEGQRNVGSTSFLYNNAASIAGNAFPLVEVLPTSSGYQFENLQFNANKLQQIGFVLDASSVFGLLMDRIAFGSSNSASNVNTPAAVIKGPTESTIGYPGNQNACSTSQIALGPPCIRITTQSLATGGAAGTYAAASSLKIHGFAFQGSGASIQIDSLPLLNSGGASVNLVQSGPYEIKDFLREVGKGPFIRLAYAGVGTTIRLDRGDDDAPNASPGNGFIDAAYTLNPTPTIDTYNIGTSVGGQVIVAGGGNVTASGYSSFAAGTTLSGTAPLGGVGVVSGGNVATAGYGIGIQASGISAVGYAMPRPNTPTVAVGGHGSCSVNCVAAGTYYYAIVANDANGKNSLPSPNSTAATTDGTQTVTVSWVPVAGQVTTGRARGASPTLTGTLADPIGTGIQGTSYVDGTVFYSVSPPLSGPGNSVSLSSAGLATSGIIYVNSGFSDTIGGTLSANRSQTLPDVTGIFPVTSYVNSAYDNATRSNGAIGSNWTVQQNGLNIASNQIQGTSSGASNTGFWNANSFSPVQFAQVTINALNGASDFPGVTLLATGTGASSTYYDCVENTTNIYLQRVVSGASTNLTSTASAGAVGDILRLDAAPGGVLTCFKNGVSTLTATDTQITSGSPGLLISGNVATEKNWSGGNLHPLGQLDSEQDWTRPQHFAQGVTVGATNNPSLARYGRYTSTLSPASVAANTCAAQSFTVTGVLASDILIGVNKPTEQAGLSVTTGHVTGANTATINFCNNTAASITPTASETYNFVVVQ